MAPREGQAAATARTSSPAGDGGTHSAGAMAAAAAWTSRTWLPTGRSEGAILLIEKETESREVGVGAPFAYRVAVTNLTETALARVVLTETFDPAFTCTGAQPDGERGEGSLRFELGSLGPGQASTVSLTGTAARVGGLANRTSVAYEMVCALAVEVVQPALAVAAVQTPAIALACDDLVLEVVVTNPGTGTARDVRVHDRLPKGLLTADGEAEIEHDFGTLGAGERRTQTFKLRAGGAGSFTHEVEAKARGGLAAKAAPVSVKVVQPLLTVSAAGPAGTQQPGRRAEFTFTVANAGECECTETKAVVTLSGGVELIAADHGGTLLGDAVTWQLGTIPAGQARTLTVACRLPPPGSVTANLKASARGAVEALASCAADVVGMPDIGSHLGDDGGVTPVGRDQVYRCEVENQGQVDLTDVRVVALWPTELQFVGHTAASQSVPEGNTITWKVGTLAPKQKLAWSLTLKAKKAGEYVIRTTTTAKEIKNRMTMEEITTFVD